MRDGWVVRRSAPLTDRVSAGKDLLLAVHTIGRRLSILLALVFVVGCSGGSSTSFTPPTPPPLPSVFELNPRFGSAGDVITFRATGIDSNPLNLEAPFLDTTGTITQSGRVLSVTDAGFQQGQGTIFEVEVLVPGGVRSGTVSLLSNGISFGGFGFDAAPEVIGVGVGDAAQFGAVTRSTSGQVFPDEVLLYGYNLSGVTSVVIDDGTAMFNASTLIPGPPVGLSVPQGLQMIQVGLPTGLSPFTCETVALSIRCESLIQSGVILRSGWIDVPFSGIANGSPITTADIPGYLNGAMVPPGVRRGDIVVDYSFLMDETGSRFQVAIEYQDPLNLANWLPCTPTTDTNVGHLLPGSRVVTPGGALLGPGARHRFTWDSATDLPLGAPITTRMRIRPFNPIPALGAQCPAGEWETPLIVIDPDAPSGGGLVENFDSTTQLDPTGGDAVWGSGLLAAPMGGSSPFPMWGLGTINLNLLDGRSYEFDTTARTLIDVTDPMAPIPLVTSNPGAPFGEFHLRSLIVAPTAVVTVFGSSPLIFRCSGDGADSFPGLKLEAPLLLEGRAGEAGTITDPGSGGLGGTGGSRGGDGARIEVDSVALVVLSVDPAEDADFGGGTAGQSTTYIQAGTGTSSPRAGCGGGGGGALPGEDAQSQLDSQTSAFANPGLGGAALGDPELVIAVGGTGGGGGGAATVRSSVPAQLIPKHGGGGGGGGGAIQFFVRGRAELHSVISVAGGDGAPGTSSSQAGAGGGGGGGSIAVRSTGTLEVFATAQLLASGGAGAIQVGGTPLHRGGDGADGTIRLESNTLIIEPNPLPPDLFVGNLSTGTFSSSGRSLSRGRSLPYRLTTADGVTVGAPTTFLTPVIMDGGTAPAGSTQVIAIYEGAAPSISDPTEPGEFRGLTSDPTLLDAVEYLRVRWFLFSDQGVSASVDQWELPFTHP